MKENEDGKALPKRVKRIWRWLQTYGLFILFFAALVIVGIKNVEKKTRSAYQDAIAFFLDGEYEQASEKFEEAEAYKNAEAYGKLCQAILTYEEGRYAIAYHMLPKDSEVDFSEAELEERAVYRQWKNEIIQKGVEEITEPHLLYERLNERLPYVGMSERDINGTMLGSYTKRFTYGGKNAYTWQNSVGYYFYVYCRDGEVVEVRDCRDDPVKSIRFVSRPRASSTPNPYPGDIYGIGSIRDAEELYEEYPDDFESIDEAEEYFNAYRK